MNSRRMEEEQDSVDGGICYKWYERRDWEIAMDKRIREEKDGIIDDYGIATMTSVDARR